MSEADGAVALVVEGRPRTVGNSQVSRSLPSMARRMVGPFVFLDRMGPVALERGHGFDVKPYPHMGLSTLTYLFEADGLQGGRDNVQVIRGRHETSREGEMRAERVPECGELLLSPCRGRRRWARPPRARSHAVDELLAAHRRASRGRARTTSGAQPFLEQPQRPRALRPPTRTE